MTLAALLEVLPKPDHPVETVDAQQWAMFELITGIELPVDYKDYLQVFGTGVIGGMIAPYNPFCHARSRCAIPVVTGRASYTVSRH